MITCWNPRPFAVGGWRLRLALLSAALAPNGEAFAQSAPDETSASPAVPTYSPTGSTSSRLNLLIVTVDTLRADHLGCYGYFRDTSPTIDALARESLLFDRCLVPVAQTLPSHLSLMTGVYPMEHGVLSNLEKPGGGHFVSTPQLRTLAEFLRGEGYRTAAFVSATPLKRDSGINAGFDDFSQPDHARRLGADTTRAVLDWMRDRKDEPFFLWVHYFDPHAPYEAPAPFAGLFSADEKLQAHMEQRRIEPRVRKQRNDRRVVPEEDEWDTRKAINGYDGEIRYTDEQIKALIERLRATGLFDRTAIVFTADHGEGLGQHGIVMHDAIWDEQLHVPLILRIPGRSPRRVSAPMRSVDIVPTVLSLMPNLPSDAFTRQCRGSDALSRTREVELFGQEPQGRSSAVTLVSDEWKLMLEGKTAQLFHLPTDPFELHDVASEKPGIVSGLRERLTALVDEQAAAAKRYQAGRPAGAAAPGAETDPRRRDELRGLGYLDSDEGDEETGETKDSRKKKSPKG